MFSGALASLHSSFVYAVNSLTSSIIHCSLSPSFFLKPVITVYMLVAPQSQHNTIASLISYRLKGFKHSSGRTHRVPQPELPSTMKRLMRPYEDERAKRVEMKDGIWKDLALTLSCMTQLENVKG